MNLRDQVLMYAGRIVKWAVYSANNGFGRGYVQGPQEDQSLGEQPIQQPVRILQNFGFRSMPLVAGGESVTVAARGGPANAIAVVVDNQTVGPKDLKEGESCQYCKADGARVKLDENGQILVDASANQDIVVNGGNARVGRVGDPCGWLVYQTTVVSGSTVVASLGWVSADPGRLVPPNFKIALSITDGAPHVKA